MPVDIYRRTPEDGLTLAELRLYHQIMDYRAGLGLDPVPLSRSLTTTAGRHVADVRENFWAEDRAPPKGANLHSWSDAPYWEDHRKPEAMWEAPARLGTGYNSAGYEIIAAGQADATAALAAWQASPGHQAVLAQTGVWASVEFSAIGIGLDTGYQSNPYGGRVYSVWFGEAEDRAGAPPIVGTPRADRIEATAFDDRVQGNGGNDRILGLAGDDTLFAGAGRDTLSGGRGDDRLVAGPGPDALAGGPGADTFVFRAAAHADGDRIADFDLARDRLDLSGIDANANRPGNQALDFGPSGSIAFAHGSLAGEVHGGADFQIELAGVRHLSPDNLLL